MGSCSHGEYLGFFAKCDEKEPGMMGAEVNDLCEGPLWVLYGEET